MKRVFSGLGPWRTAALGVCALLAVLAYVLKFRLPGYSFSALVCVALIGVILFYSFFPLLMGRFPRFTKWTLRICTAILVVGLGAKVRDSGPSVSLWDRIYGARDYLQSHPDAVAVLSGGQGPDEPMTEAQAMYDELVKLGISPDRLLLEDRATSTWENLNYSLDLIEETFGTRPEKLGVLSSEYHLFRASLFTKACGVEFVGIPAQTSRLSQKVNHFMREVAGVWHYILLEGSHYD